MKKLSFFAILVSMALVFTACPGPDDPKVLESITISGTLYVQVGTTTTLTAAPYPAGIDVDITWSSNNTAVATVADGVVTGVTVGTAQITAASGTVTQSVTITVTAEPVPEPESITITPASLTVQVGATGTLTAEIYPEGTGATITWSSSNTAVATVADGVVTGVAAGNAVITAAAGSVTQTANVTVQAGPINPFTRVLQDGDEFMPVRLTDAVAFAAIEDRIVVDLTTTDDHSWFYIWHGYSEATPGGLLNPFGRAGEIWVHLQVNPGTTWSGGGFFMGNNYGDAAAAATAVSRLNTMASTIAQNPDEWYVHMAVRSRNAAHSHWFFIDGPAGPPDRGGFLVGTAPLVIDGQLRHPHPNAGIPADGLWHQVFIPFTDLIANGLRLGTYTIGQNVFAFLSGDAAGSVIEFDAVFFVRNPHP